MSPSLLKLTPKEGHGEVLPETLKQWRTWSAVVRRLLRVSRFLGWVHILANVRADWGQDVWSTALGPS